MPNLDPVRATDEELFRAVSTGGELVAWQMLYNRYSGPLGGYAHKILQAGRCYDPPDHVRDVNQETWFRIVKSVSQCCESPVGWLYRITRNTSYDHLQQCVRMLDHSEAWPDSPAEEERLLAPRARLYSHEEIYLRRLALEQALSRLSPDEQLILRLRRDGLDYKEISRLTGFSAVNARKLFQRAKQRLMEASAEEGN